MPFRRRPHWWWSSAMSLRASPSHHLETHFAPVRLILYYFRRYHTADSKVSDVSYQLCRNSHQRSLAHSPAGLPSLYFLSPHINFSPPHPSSNCYSSTPSTAHPIAAANHTIATLSLLRVRCVCRPACSCAVVFAGARTPASRRPASATFCSSPS
jgi:hypothetical protein